MSWVVSWGMLLGCNNKLGRRILADLITTMEEEKDWKKIPFRFSAYQGVDRGQLSRTLRFLETEMYLTRYNKSWNMLTLNPGIIRHHSIYGNRLDSSFAWWRQKWEENTGQYIGDDGSMKIILPGGELIDISDSSWG